MTGSRITLKDLEAVCARINRAAGENEQAVVRNGDGTYTWNVGTYTLDGAYGGWALDRISGEHGGVTNIIGRGTKRELYGQMQAFVNGMGAVS